MPEITKGDPHVLVFLISSLHAVAAEHDEGADRERDTGDSSEAVHSGGDHREGSLFSRREIAGGEDIQDDQCKSHEDQGAVDSAHDGHEDLNKLIVLSFLDHLGVHEHCGHNSKVEDDKK